MKFQAATSAIVHAHLLPSVEAVAVIMEPMVATMTIVEAHHLPAATETTVTITVDALLHHGTITTAVAAMAVHHLVAAHLVPPKTPTHHAAAAIATQTLMVAHQDAVATMMRTLRTDMIGDQGGLHRPRAAMVVDMMTVRPGVTGDCSPLLSLSRGYP